MTAWWQQTTVYQIYPRSFQDSNGDGIGDLRGIFSRLDYLVELGVETIWISPFYPSPLADHGYDITDYYGVAPEYGTLDDFDELLAAAHDRGLKVLLDMVLSHTSDQHPWFLESRESRGNPKADWYIWQAGRGRKPPTNWIALPGGRGWHYDRKRDEWYLASFLPFQPDLNWRNPEVKAEMFGMIRHWLGRGIDGFRLDLFTALMKDAEFRNNPFRPGLYEGMRPYLHHPAMQHNHPDIFVFAKELRRVIGEFDNPERVLLGEVMGTREELRELLGGEANDGLNLVFNFDMIMMLRWQRSAKWFRRLLEDFEKEFPFPMHPTLVFGNHDMRRLLSRFGDDLDFARVLALFQMTARGVPVIYMGEEIGMTDVYIPKSGAQDPISKNWHWIPDRVRRWLPVNVNRDMNRSPMQWTADTNAGFCAPGLRPWLPVHPENWAARNVAVQEDNPDSHLNLYRNLLRLRRESPALHQGALTLRGGFPKDILAYERHYGEDRVGIVINFGKHDRECRLEGTGADALLLTTDNRVRLGSGRLRLPGKSGCVYRPGKS
jgi:alpha-glucosidase